MATAYPILLAAVPGTILLDIQIPNTRDGGFHPHLVDVYEPNGNISFALCALHGGGAGKRYFAAALGILRSAVPTPQTVVWSAMNFWHCALMVPQGQHPSGVDPELGAGNNDWNPDDVTTVSAQFPNGVALWSDHARWSGVDDPQFLKDCATWQLNRYGLVFRILAGHSEGGIMTNRMWYEHSGAEGYSAYMGAAGPASVYYLANPTLPAIVQPWFGQFGEQDSNFSIIGGHFYDEQWSTANPTVADVDPPTMVIGDWYQLQTRVDAYNAANSLPPQTISVSDGVTTASNVGTQTSWSYCDGNVGLILRSAADHSTKSLQQCAGRGLFSQWLAFAASTLA